MEAPRVKEDAFRKGCLSRINVRRNTDVAGLIERKTFVVRASHNSWFCGGKTHLAAHDS
jgi:hypothetical protein